MKWKYTPLPDIGQTKVTRKFAFFPTLVGGDFCKYWVWLEFYSAHYRYSYNGWCHVEDAPG